MQFIRLKSAFSVPWQRTLLVLFVAQTFVAVGFSSIFPFLPLYVDSLGTNTQFSLEFLAGMVYSGQAFTMMLASPVWGALADRYGRKIMVQRSMFGGAILLVLMAFARTAEELVILRAIQGLVTGTIAAANALVAAGTPKENTGFAMGFLQVGLGAGIALGPLLGGSLADAYGYNIAFYVTAVLLLIAGIIVHFGVQEHFEGPPPNSSNGKRDAFLTSWKNILATTGVFTTYSMRFVTQLGRMMIVPIAPLLLQVLLPDSAHLNTFTGLVVGSAAATTTLSAVYLGRLGDRIGHRKILIVCSFLATLLYFPQSLVTAGWQLLVLQALVGIAMGGITPAISALLARYTTHSEAGAVYGLDNSINAGARAVAPLLGAGVAAWFTLRTTFLATAIVFTLAGVLAAWRLPKLGYQAG